jgi:purine-binding chemotaxis protein CheW
MPTLPHDPADADRLAGDMAEFVTFQAGGQSFSLDIAQVREIRRWSPVTPLPHALDGVLGVMNLRGTVIPIYDLAARFDLGATPESARNVIVVALAAGRTLGLLVEAVSEILSVPRSQIQDAPEMRADMARTAITGIVPLEDGMTRVIDLDVVVDGRGGVPRAAA